MPISVRYNVSPILTGGLNYLAGQAERQRQDQAAAQEMALRQMSLGEQARQFDARQVLAELEFRANQQHASQQQQLALEQVRQRDRALQADMLDREMRSNARLNEIALQGEMQRAMYGDQLTSQLMRESLRQQGMFGRERNAARERIEAKRLEQRFREMDRDREAILKAALTQEQLDDAASQFEMKWGEPLDQLVPPQYATDETDPVSVLGRLQEQYPDTPFMIHPDGSVGVPKGWKREFDPKAREEERQLEEQEAAAKAEMDAEKQRRTADLAAEKERRAAERAERQSWVQEEIDFHKELKPDRKDYMDETADPLTGVAKKKFDAAGYKSALDQWQAEHRKLLDALRGGPMPGSDEAEQQGSEPPDWYKALPSGATYTAPDGTKRIKP